MVTSKLQKMKKLFCLMLLYSILNIVHAQQWQFVTNAVTPSALRGGNEANGTVLYIARVKHENGVHIGKARPNSREAFIAYGGKELALSNYEVFTGTGQWVKATANSFPPNAIAGGYEANGAPLYIARAVIDGGYHPGKARKNGDGFIPYGGVERIVKDFEVLTSNPVATITRGTYHIRSQIDNKPMDVVNGQNANGNGLHLWDFHGGDAQQFTIEPSNEAGYYYIKTKWGRVLTIKDRSNASGATLYTWDFQGGDNQKWRFINRGNGYHNIESKYRTYIDVKGGGNAIGTPIHLSDYSMWGNNIAQLWKLETAGNTSTSIILNNIDEWLCPSAVLRGDREFDGHGPRVKCEVTLKIGDAGRALYADIYFWAQETTSDWSTTERRWSKKVYDAPYGKTITAINSDKSSRTQFVSPAAGFELLAPGADVATAVNGFLDGVGGTITSAVLASFGIPPGDFQAVARLITGYINNGDTVVKLPALEGTLVRFFHIVGDTGGADISDDDNCNADTRIMKLEFNPVKVTMR
jgi:Protein of unknown function (DUF3421)/Ricin-type beta-trefoil lectin domain-like